VSAAARLLILQDIFDAFQHRLFHILSMSKRGGALVSNGQSRNPARAMFAERESRYVTRSAVLSTSCANDPAPPTPPGEAEA
jgi:hypothetical protein